MNVIQPCSRRLFEAALRPPKLFLNDYQNAIKYGTDPNKVHWYICPRYWCIKDNTSLTEEEVKAGVCGGQIIPHGAKKIPKGKYIFEFTSPEGTRAYSDFFDKDGDYITHYPGFTKDNTHPGGCGVPCCFKSWTAPSQQERREKCDMSSMDMETLSKTAEERDIPKVSITHLRRTVHPPFS